MSCSDDGFGHVAHLMKRSLNTGFKVDAKQNYSGVDKVFEVTTHRDAKQMDAKQMTH